MKKILKTAISALLLCSLFVACSSTSATDTSSTADASSTPESSTEESSEASSEEEEEPENNELNLYTWEGMFPQEILDGFEAETGIKVNYNSFDTNETMLSRLQTTGGGDYDLVISDDYIIETVIAEGLAQKIDTNLIENIGNVNPAYQGQFFDPTNEYTVPHGAGVLTLVYDPNLVSIEIDSYADLWDKSLQSNLGIIGNYRVINGITLLSMGHSMNTEDVAVISEAGTKLLELAPNIRLIKDDSIQEDLLSGEIGVAVMYTSQTTMAMLANPSLEIVFPSEGVGFGVMGQFIPSNAPNPEAAHAFIDYVLQPENGKAAFEYLGFYSTNSAADELIAEEYKPFLTLPEEFDIETLEMIQNISSEALDEHDKIWTTFKSATE